MVEACVDSVEGALASERAGAGRVELCGPGVGGTTPSFGLMSRCRERLRIPMHVMIRPREGNFAYNDGRIRNHDQGHQCRAQCSRGWRGVRNSAQRFNTLDEDRMRTLVETARDLCALRVIVHSTRHRNRTPRWTTLLQLGVDLVLTSGHAATTAMEGRAQLKHALRERAGEQTCHHGGRWRACVQPALTVDS